MAIFVYHIVYTHIPSGRFYGLCRKVYFIVIDDLFLKVTYFSNCGDGGIVGREFLDVDDKVASDLVSDQGFSTLVIVFCVW